MVYRPIIIVAGEPNSIFSEIFLKSIKYKKFKSPIILIASYRLIQQQMRKLNIYRKIRLVNFLELKKNHLDNKDINLYYIDPPPSPSISPEIPPPGKSSPVITA